MKKSNVIIMFGLFLGLASAAVMLLTYINAWMHNGQVLVVINKFGERSFENFMMPAVALFITFSLGVFIKQQWSNK